MGCAGCNCDWCKGCYKCGGTTVGKQGGRHLLNGTEGAADAGVTGLCEDLEAFLGMTLPELTKHISSIYCANPSKSIGIEFAAGLVALFDKDYDGTLSCSEYGSANGDKAMKRLKQFKVKARCPFNDRGQANFGRPQ